MDTGRLALRDTSEIAGDRPVEDGQALAGFRGHHDHIADVVSRDAAAVGRPMSACLLCGAYDVAGICL